MSDLLFGLNELRSRLVKLISVAKEERADAIVFAQELRDRIIVLETKADQGQTKLQDHEARITTLEGG